ncbi:hypothetical protein KKD62_01095, partial [Patescibacteria group bacterium]|nr:hypothetical protein [Patescibacteria group bacterium]MBU1931345.1 hypothetical protein [Patescibacteria group bacterium]
SMQKRIREAEIQKVPYILVIGDKEQSKQKINLRTRGKKQTQELGLNEFIKLIKQVVEQKLL